jgi:inner membrane transporter RhtA
LAALLFVHLSVLGVAWLRIVTAAAFFVLWRRPWRRWRRMTGAQRKLVLALGIVLAGMNTLFYLAVARLPLSTVGAVEFLGSVILAAAGARTRRNWLASSLAVAGVATLTNARLVAEPLGFVFAFLNCAGFMLYVVLGHRIANTRLDADPDLNGTALMGGIDLLGGAMMIAAVAATPFGLSGALPAFTHPTWLIWGVVVGLCSSVIPYVSDQLAMARLSQATFSLMLALLPAAATGIGLVVLGQVPSAADLVGVGLVITGVALHQERGRGTASTG